MNVLGLVAFDIGAFFVILFCLVNSVHFKREYRLQQLMFRWLLIVSMLSAFFAVAEILITNYWMDVTGMYFIRYIVKTCFILTQITSGPIFALYLMCTTGLVQALNRMQYVLLMMPFLALVILAFLNPAIGGKLFYYDSDGQMLYHRGAWLFLVYVEVIFYVVFGTIALLKYRSAMRQDKLITIIAAIAFATAGVLIEKAFPNLRITTFGETLCYLSFLLNIEITQFEFDSVSGLFNRAALMAAVNRKCLTGQKFAVLYVDFSNFRFCVKVLNGEERDRMSYELGHYLQGIDIQVQCYSLGISEFVLLLPNESMTIQAHVVGEIKRKFSQDFRFEGRDFTLHVTTVMLRSPDQFATSQELSELLEIEFPDDGKRVTYLADDKLAFIKREADVAKALQSALAEHRLNIFYQPIWMPHTHRLYAAEALSRLTDPELGFIPPDEFIPVAERNGMIIQLGEYVLEESCKLLHDYKEELGIIEYIEINLSVHQLLMNDLPERFIDIMNRYGITTEQINLEITESAAGDESDIFDKTLARLRDMGFAFSLDDFGTGYSNMARLFNMEFTNVKIDKSLLWNANRSKVSRDFLESMVTTIHTMGSHVIQEGVETEEQLSYMKNLDCDLIQGFYYSKALAPEDFVKYVLQETKKQQEEAARTAALAG